MLQKLKSVAKFGIVMFAMTIACAIIWQIFIPGRLYDCSDNNMQGFFRPGDWVHHPVSVPHIVLSKTMSEPDTIKEGWSVTDLWLLWFLFVGVSIAVSVLLARRRWLPNTDTILTPVVAVRKDRYRRMKVETFQWSSPGRPCSFCLCLQGGGVFADFDTDDAGIITLCRISYDCFGCEEAGKFIQKMNSGDSRLLLDAIAHGELGSIQVEQALRRYFQENKHVLWSEALEMHDLL